MYGISELNLSELISSMNWIAPLTAVFLTSFSESLNRGKYMGSITLDEFSYPNCLMMLKNLLARYDFTFQLLSPINYIIMGTILFLISSWLKS